MVDPVKPTRMTMTTHPTHLWAVDSNGMPRRGAGPWRLSNSHKNLVTNQMKTSWWLNQPLWKICSSNWVHLPQVGMNIKNIWNHHQEDTPIHQENLQLEPPQKWVVCRCCSMFFPFPGWYFRVPAVSFRGEERLLSIELRYATNTVYTYIVYIQIYNYTLVYVSYDTD